MSATADLVLNGLEAGAEEAAGFGEDFAFVGGEDALEEEVVGGAGGEGWAVGVEAEAERDDPGALIGGAAADDGFGDHAGVSGSAMRMKTATERQAPESRRMP